MSDTSEIEALAAAALHAMACDDNPGHQDWHDCATTGPCADEGRRFLAALVAPQPAETEETTP
jgi:hypothetical protein